MDTYNYNKLNYGKGMCSGASSNVNCSCQLRLSINSLLDCTKEPCLKTLHPRSPQGHWLPWPGPPLFEVFSLFSLTFNKLSATGKTSDSVLHSYQELRPTGGGVSRLSSTNSKKRMNSKENLTLLKNVYPQHLLELWMLEEGKKTLFDGSYSCTHK